MAIVFLSPVFLYTHFYCFRYKILKEYRLILFDLCKKFNKSIEKQINLYCIVVHGQRKKEKKSSIKICYYVVLVLVGKTRD